MEVQKDRRYTKEHEWVLTEGKLVRVGISDFAQHELGDIVYADLPPIGTAVSAGQTFMTVESVKAVSDVYAPIAGTISARNEAIAASPELINTEPYAGGWLVIIAPNDPAEVDRLMDAAAYERYLGDLEK